MCANLRRSIILPLDMAHTHGGVSETGMHFDWQFTNDIDETKITTKGIPNFAVMSSISVASWSNELEGRGGYDTYVYIRESVEITLRILTARVYPIVRHQITM